jgi:hypothetical protein
MADVKKKKKKKKVDAFVALKLSTSLLGVRFYHISI